MDSEVTEQRGTKRVRQACINCRFCPPKSHSECLANLHHRRKKTRCSGERPVCSFCARLKQTCRYNDSVGPGGPSSYEASLQQVNSGLAARVALLESRLSLLDANGSNDATLSSLFGVNMNSPQFELQTSSSPRDGLSQDPEFPSMLDIDTLQSLADVYFRCCHNQPYSFFHEETFRQSLIDFTLPSYIIWAFVATTIRFSKHPYFVNRQTQATDWYARLAWSEVVREAFIDNHNIDISIVQATSMLGVIDYISGRDQLAWTKFGLAIRFAQTLQLGRDSDSSTSPNEAEERRNTFWSVYILDRLSSCGRNRPPALLDSDCTGRLPSSEGTHGSSGDTTTLVSMHEIPGQPLLASSDHFALTIFMVSTFGNVVRWVFRHGAKDTHLPWDSRSEFARINGVLTSFETYSDACDGDFADVLDRSFVADGNLDERSACHFSFAHVLYHVNQCLLHHPFLLGQNLRSLKLKIPRNFYRDAVAKCKQHAEYLSAILRALQQRGYENYPSFFGYAAALAGAVHRLHAHDMRYNDKWAAETNYEACVSFLDQEPVVWESYRRMSGVLQDFNPSQSLAASLLSCTANPSPFEALTEEDLWHLCDYGWLTNSARRPSMSSTASRPDKEGLLAQGGLTDAVKSPDFETLLEGALSFDFGLLDQVKI